MLCTWAKDGVHSAKLLLTNDTVRSTKLLTSYTMYLNKDQPTACPCAALYEGISRTERQTNRVSCTHKSISSGQRKTVANVEE